METHPGRSARLDLGEGGRPHLSGELRCPQSPLKSLVSFDFKRGHRSREQSQIPKRGEVECEQAFKIRDGPGELRVGHACLTGGEIWRCRVSLSIRTQ